MSLKLSRLGTLLNQVLLVTLAYEQFQRGDKRATSLRNILMARHCVLHDLLTLGDYASQKISDTEEEPILHEGATYDLAWYSVLSYMVLDLYPLGRGVGPHDLLFGRLEKAIQDASRIRLHYQQPMLFKWASELLVRLVKPSGD